MSETSMSGSILFDRDITPEHYIIPGGFNVELKNGNSVQFDFEESILTIDDENPKKLNFELDSLDTESYPESKELTGNLQNIKTFNEFFVYTGEANDPEINPVKVTELSLLIKNQMRDFGTEFLNEILLTN